LSARSLKRTEYGLAFQLPFSRANKLRFPRSMSETKICPQCGMPQQWKMWRFCACGHDFSPGVRVRAVAKEEESCESQPAKYLTGERVRRWTWRLYLIAGVTFIIARPFHALHWLTYAAAFVLVALFVAPLSTFFTNDKR
jgi:hypothetical protein